jgi:hypothetical protein
MLSFSLLGARPTRDVIVATKRPLHWTNLTHRLLADKRSSDTGSHYEK